MPKYIYAYILHSFQHAQKKNLDVTYYTSMI